MNFSRKEIQELIIIILIVSDVVLLLLITFFNFPILIYDSIIAFDLLVCLILGIEFFYSLKTSENRKEYFKKNWINLIAIIPLDYFFLRIFRFVRFVRVFKLFRLFKVTIFLRKSIKSFTDFIKESHLDKVLTITIIFILSSTIIFFVLEKGIQDLSIIDSFWYVISTVTTVGYGDILPKTLYGKFLGIILIIIGILTFSILTASISSIYTKRIEKENTEDLKKEIESLNKKIDFLTEQIKKE